jgi:hypothetical protein
MAKQFHGLLSIWNGIALVIGIFSGVFLTIGQLFLGLLTAGGAISFGLIAVHFELEERYGDRFRFASLSGGLVCWLTLGLIYILINRPTNSQQQMSPPKESLVSSVKPDTINKPPPDTVATKENRKPKIKKPTQEPAKSDGDKIEIKTYGQTGGTNIGKIQIDRNMPRRRLMEQNIPSAIKRLSLYRGNRILFKAASNDNDSNELEQILKSIFVSSGWIVHERLEMMSFPPMEQGIHFCLVTNPDNPDSNLIRQANFVADVLRQLGLRIENGYYTGAISERLKEFTFIIQIGPRDDK